MKILLVNKFLYPRGGAETYTIELGKQLQSMGHEVQYFGMYDEKNICYNRSGLYVSPMDFHELKKDTATYPLRIIWSKEAYDKIKKLIKNFKPDIIHLNNFNYQLTPSIIDAAKELKVPVIMTAHDSQFVCPNHLLYDFNKNTICTKCVENHDPKHCAKNKCIHGSAIKSFMGSIEGKKYLENDTYNYISSIICPSIFMKNIYESQNRFKNKTIYLQNYTNSFNKKRTKKEDYIFYFGRLSPEKGTNNIIEAAKVLKNERFVCAGSGPAEKEMKGIDNLELVGFKTGEELYDLIRKAKLVILPSTCYENCPLAVIEAQKLGAAVIAPGYGGASELTDKEFQIKDTSPKALIEAIQKALSGNNIERMIEDNKKRIKNYLLLPKYGKEIVKIYEKVIDKKFD